ncbi:NAD/NADP octopine/nopaline dehydrogenase family protein [Roseomonas haemaphysalidis]|uniref:2-dehydropantoate 2-reductase n=1 Tax=Roseomonas haemaphysalidis TaxID=2768162 RepID=A0ABS3KP14_9PROT|nr:NAD/NADP octopine/nopaline dehydrogenase family protein [Roseomonas haemaphysalidis]MBO1079214.1 NAD/NADP octopine/nopaline dehydrogenase family protein [Roseomonas haemaphysalidis]
MRVAILGTGGIGRGYAAFLAANGHQPVLWSPTGHPPTTTLVATGVVPGRHAVEVAADCAAALAGADVAIVATVANGHRAVLDAMAPHLLASQVVVISGHCSFAALYLHRLLAARGVELPIAAWATTALTARRGGAEGVHVSGLRQRLDVATLPQRLADRGEAACRALFGDRFQRREDLLAIMLSNLNPPAHMANMLLNLTRAEQGEDWPNYGSITPAVGRVIEALDAERLALAAAFGLSVRTVTEHFVLSHNIAPGSVAEMAAAVHAKRPELLGPKTLDSRFVTEDVPFGLVPLELLGRISGVPVPLHAAGIALFSATHGRDFRAENDLLPPLALAGTTKAALAAALRG